MREPRNGSSASNGDRHELASLLGIPAAELELISPRVVSLLLAHVRMAREDSLTGLANRRGIDERLAFEWERARRHNRPLSVVLLDLDNLKEVNDQRGHEAGDDLLRAVAVQLRSTVRSIDQVGRWGGDEFLVICIETGEAAAALVGRKIADRLPAPVSYGVATLQRGQTAKELLSVADRALYRAKERRHVGHRSVQRVSLLQD